MADEQWLSRRDRAAESTVAPDFDLDECVREPIHLLGGIQSHGTLLAVDRATGLIETAANTGPLLGTDAADAVGAHIDRLLGTGPFTEVLDALDGDGADISVHLLTLPVQGTGRAFDVTAHLRDELVVLELEPRADGRPLHFPGFYQKVRSALARLRAATDAAECCRTAVREMRALTGFDRVVAYRFDGADGPGEVLAESVSDGREPWLGLWFPATDIPPQARRLYRENWIRVIGDAEDSGVPLHPPVRPGSGVPLDLSRSVLRTVSGFHLEYLRNIGVRSSMSVSVLRDGELWGLIACHGDSPVRFGPELRAACEFFGTAFSLQLAVIEERRQRRAVDRSRERLAALVRHLTGDPADLLRRCGDGLRELLGADGLVLAAGGRVTTNGAPAGSALADAVRERAARLAPGSVWHTDRFAETLAEEGDPPPATGPDAPAGVLMVPLGGSGDFLAWWRAERRVTRRWAGDPARPVRLGPRGERLTPRGSGEVFREVMRGRGEPWTPADLAAAQELWRTLTGMALRHAEELAALNDELRMINTDLDSFAHAAAHDLKEPLRGISNAATFVMEDAAHHLDEVTLRRMATMRRLAGRMDELLNSLLQYARLGRSGLRRERIPLDTALDAALDVAGERLAGSGVRVVRPPELPVLWADPQRLHEILVNLLVNAGKYADDTLPEGARTVEVGTVAVTPPGESAPVRAVVVRDNGIGIPHEARAEVFELFRRLHGPAERGGGTGVGLAVVKRIVERHDGRLWLEGEPGVGTAIHFTLGEGAPGEDPRGESPPG
ncbi:ATP-binding protein [Streptomyces sp. CAU 1734]|uniref:ATP-binding protein n=1 Tax=Streptomyces sp. CAU 1734 TaxID=3140360 RepID=UPI0032601671